MYPGTEVPIVNCEIENYKGDMQTANLDSYFVDWDYIDQFRIGWSRDGAFPAISGRIPPRPCSSMWRP